MTIIVTMMTIITKIVTIIVTMMVIIMKMKTIIMTTMMVDLNESEGHGDQAETEVGHGEIGDEHVPKRNNNYSQTCKAAHQWVVYTKTNTHNNCSIEKK